MRIYITDVIYLDKVNYSFTATRILFELNRFKDNERRNPPGIRFGVD